MKTIVDNATLRKVPQRRIPAWELAVYFVLPCLLIAAGAMPSTALFLLPAALPLLYLLYRRFGAYFPIACVGCYGLFSLVFNYDILTVVYFCFLIFAIIGLILSVQFKPYLLCAAIVFIAALVGAFTGAGIVRLAEGRLSDVAADYIRAERADPFISFLAENEYAAAELPEDIGKLDKSDAGYSDAAIEYLAAVVHDDAELQIPYYCIHFAGIFAALGYFAALAVNRKTQSPNDDGVTRDGLNASSRCLGGAVRELTPIAKMKFPRTYLWAVLLPAFVCAMILDFVGGFEMLAACIMHAFITLPTTFAFITLGAYFCSLFTGKKARVAARIVYGLVAASMFAVPMALFVCSIIGICDVILNLRFWTEFIRN